MPEPNFEQELRDLINKHSKENESNTPDFVLAKYILSTLNAFTHAVLHRDMCLGEGER